MPLDWDALTHGPVERIFGEQGKGAAALPLYTAPGAIAGYVVDGIFDSGFVSIEALDGTPSSTVENTFGAALSKFRAMPVQGARLHIPRVGKTYLVREVQPDGHGWVLLKLNKA